MGFDQVIDLVDFLGQIEPILLFVLSLEFLESLRREGDFERIAGSSVPDLQLLNGEVELTLF